MKVERHFTAELKKPYDGIVFEKRKSTQKGIEVTVPVFWSQIATDILAEKYLFRSGGKKATENDARQVFHRMAGCWAFWGKKLGYFGKKDAEAFYDETCFMLAHQMAAPNSPQWFNTGIHFAYGLEGLAQGHSYVDAKSGELKKSKNAYEHPQPHACFIQAIKDNLVNESGIMDLWVREARLFKFGSGTGTNFSSLRSSGEPLSGGGSSSGLMSFLKIGDQAAGAVRSGGTTRRAAKMVCLDLDHPEIESFIEWKVIEEQKVSALVAGSRAQRQRLTEVLKAQPDNLAEAVENARTSYVPERFIEKVLEMKANGIREFEFLELDSDWQGEAYQTVSGQHSNNSIQVPDAFFEKLKGGGTWPLRRRVDGKVVKEMPASELWEKIALAAWSCADPGLQFESTINAWHTCLEDGRIHASNPCSEYLFLDDTACNLASLNLLKFWNEKTAEFDVKAFEHAVRVWTLVLEISVAMAQFPSPDIAQRSYEYRTLGLGYANLGALLMSLGTAYGSDDALAWTAGITALMSGRAYATSAEMAAELGPFARFRANKKSMLRVVKRHEKALGDIAAEKCPKDLLDAAKAAWRESVQNGEREGFRNAQVTAIAPTGTIGLVMDCDTMGIEPDYSLVKFKKLAGGGHFKITNQSLPRALRRLGYTEEEIEQLSKYCAEKGTLEGAKGLDAEDLAVFDCATPNGTGRRFISYQAHIDMMAAAQPFVSGGISKTLNMPHSASVNEVKTVFETAWKKGLKSIAIYRDGSKLSQPLSTDAPFLCPQCGQLAEGICRRCSSCSGATQCS